MSSAALPCLMLLIPLMLVLLPVALGLTQTEIDELTKDGEVTVTTDGEYYVIESDGTPIHTTDSFPTSYNPNSISTQSHKYYVLKSPECDSAKCLNMGVIAISRSGVPFFSPYTAEMNDAVTGPYKETFDSCDGHPEMTGVYHYHKDPTCISQSQEKTSKFIGVALDGFSIYNKYNDDGSLITSKDLDQCHGRTANGVYRYHITDDFPYVMGCYRGTVHKDAVNSRGQCKVAEATAYITDESCGDSGSSSVRSLSVASSVLLIAAVCVLFQ